MKKIIEKYVKVAKQPVGKEPPTPQPNRRSTGYRLEHRVETLYREHGWLATRFPRSGKDYPDVLAVKRCIHQIWNLPTAESNIHLVECKNLTKNKYLYLDSKQKERLLWLGDFHGATPLIVYSFPRKHPRVINAQEVNGNRVNHMDGVLFKKFLEIFD